jgi:predicted component of type VI protein secretion system
MITSREQAYAQLAEITDFLLEHDKHSPVPHLLRRAVHWGSLDTPALYQELFVKHGGQVNIFELVGLTRPDT